MIKDKKLTNIFGDVRAENDHKMLEASFYESQNYRTLLESDDRFIAIGRRGTGKSALVYKLEKDWATRRHITKIIAPLEEQVMGLRPIASLFGENVLRIRIGIKLVWKYALLMEILNICQSNYKTSSEISKFPYLKEALKKWNEAGHNIFERLRRVLKTTLPPSKNPEDLIGELPHLLEINKITKDVLEITKSLKQKIILLIDRLDEGYEPDIVGVGLVDGIIYGTDEIRTALGDSFKAIIFLRDNIFRAIQRDDQDFSRNLEGQVLRLHWDPEELFFMVTKRIKVAFNLQQESTVKIWNAITTNEIQGKQGFISRLRLTLYRPRDVIALLNTAIEQAKRQNRETLTSDDFEYSSKQISINRFDDLGKEYESVFPGLKQLTKTFNYGECYLSYEDIISKITLFTNTPNLEPIVLQHIKILETPEEIIKALHGIGFVGFYDGNIRTYIFSHDGRSLDKILDSTTKFMIHPCYWSALGLNKAELEQYDAEQIFDEYEITIDSQSVEQRNKSLGRLIQDLTNIELGTEGAMRFEDWCKKAIEIAFAKALTNIQHHPNGNAAQRRDIVATNLGDNGFWKRIREDYNTRQDK